MTRTIAVLLALTLAAPVAVKPAAHPAAEAQTLELAKQLIAIRSVRGDDGGDTTSSPASVMRPDFEAAPNKAVQRSYPGIAIIPSQASGASDSDDFSLGLNERVPLSNTAPGIVCFLSILTALSK